MYICIFFTHFVIFSFCYIPYYPQKGYYKINCYNFDVSTLYTSVKQPTAKGVLKSITAIL